MIDEYDAIRDRIARLESRAEDALLAGQHERLERLAAKLDTLYRELADAGPCPNRQWYDTSAELD